MSRRPEQVEMRFRSWGGAWPGAGRPPAARKAGISHLKRPIHAAREPVHVTRRVGKDVPNLRTRRAFSAVRRAIAAGRERFGGRVAQFSVQSNHVHMIVGAADRRTLSRFLQGLSIRVARALNRATGRAGEVFVSSHPREPRGR